MKASFGGKAPCAPDERSRPGQTPSPDHGSRGEALPPRDAAGGAPDSPARRFKSHGPGVTRCRRAGDATASRPAISAPEVPTACSTRNAEIHRSFRRSFTLTDQPFENCVDRRHRVRESLQSNPFAVSSRRTSRAIRRRPPCVALRDTRGDATGREQWRREVRRLSEPCNRAIEGTRRNSSRDLHRRRGAPGERSAFHGNYYHIAQIMCNYCITFE